MNQYVYKDILQRLLYDVRDMLYIKNFAIIDLVMIFTIHKNMKPLSLLFYILLTVQCSYKLDFFD